MTPTNVILVLSTLATLYTAPQGPTRGPASTEPQSPTPAANALYDPCEGRGRVDGVVSAYDDEPHTCVCSVVKGLRQRPVRVDVRCW